MFWDIMQHMLVVVLCKNPQEQRPHNKLMIFVKVKEFPTSNIKKKILFSYFLIDDSISWLYRKLTCKPHGRINIYHEVNPLLTNIICKM